MVVDIITHLFLKKVDLRVEDGRLRYKAPKNVTIDTELKDLKQHKDIILKKVQSIHLNPQFKESNIRRIFPLSRGQNAIWFIDQMAPENSAYNISYCAQINDKINNEIIQQAFQKIIDRHSSLRCTFNTIEGKPICIHHNKLKIKIKEIDVSIWPDEQIKQLIEKESDKSFDLVHDPIFRIKLLKRSDKKKLLLLVTHHIALDFWSLELIINELQLLYKALLQDKISDRILPKLDYQFADYLYWQEKYIRSQECKRNWEFWKTKLTGQLPKFSLLTDHNRESIQTFNGDVLREKLDPQLFIGLQKFVKSYGVTFNMALFATYFVSMHIFTEQDDLIIGTPVAGRERVEFKNVVGYCVNLVPIRITFNRNKTFSKLLEEIRQNILFVLKNQNLPFPLLIEKLKIERDISKHPLFQIIFNWNSTKTSDMLENSFQLDQNYNPMDLHLETIHSEQRGAAFDINLTIVETKSSLETCWYYNTDLYDKSTIERFSRYYNKLLEQMIRYPQKSISSLSLLNETEQYAFLKKVNHTQTDKYHFKQLTHEVFETQVVKNPQKLAVQYKNKHITYDELNKNANKLARFLNKKGIVTENKVAILLEPSVNLITAILAVLKSDGAYIPLDPTIPKDRLNFILNDSEASIIITQEKFDEITQDSPVEIIHIDSDYIEIKRESDQNSKGKTNSQNLAYTIYTSGSTGKPKGVCITHRSLTNLLLSIQSRTNFTHNDSLLGVTTISFDIAAIDVFLPLISGASLHIASRESSRDGKKLSYLLEKYSITVMQATPSTWELLVATDWKKNDQLRILCGGEALSPNLARQLLEKYNTVWNVYGPTETTIWSTMHKLNNDPRLLKDNKVLIGLPIENTQVYIIGRYNNIAPIGVPGELHIGGEGLARNYQNQPALTGQQFIPNPFDDKPGSRLYKTGDYARFLSDGNIEYLNRIDYQVKIRGYRIELGEIETALSVHPFVKKCAVIVKKNKSGNQNLIAFIVQVNKIKNGIAILRNFLKEKLPVYMIPSSFIFIKEIPLTTNGKINIKALLKIDKTIDHQQKSSNLSLNPIVLSLIDIWKEILEINQIDINDNFFELGGHSLLVAGLISRIQDTLSIELSVHHIFKYPTIAELSEFISLNQSQNIDSHLTTIERITQKENIPLSFAQERLWFIDRFENRSNMYNIFGAYRISGALNVNALEQSINELCQRHDALRTYFNEVDGKPVQMISDFQYQQIPQLDLRNFNKSNQDLKIKQILEKEAFDEFDLSKNNLLRVLLIQVNNTEYILSITIHHIICDRWSIELIKKEVANTYNSSSKGHTYSMDDLPFQYADYALWQRQLIKKRKIASQLRYWENQLNNIPSALPLVTDRIRPPINSYNGNKIYFYIEQELSERIKNINKETGTTQYMVLLLTYSVLLYHYSAQKDILIGTPVANRNRKEFEELIGFFINTVVMRIDLSGDPTVGELLARVLKVTLDAYANKEIPFERVVDNLEINRNINSTPVFQVMFVFEKQSNFDFQLSGLNVQPIELEKTLAKFDLNLFIDETEKGFSCCIEYNSDLFEPSTIKCMAKHFTTLLRAISINLKKKLSDLPTLSKDDQYKVLKGWNQTKTDYSSDKLIHHLFEEQAQKFPEAIALIHQGLHLSYFELNEKSDRLANYLKELGIGAEKYVGVCLERSFNLITVLLSILKAGGAYIPLESSYPKNRLKSMIQDAKPALIITQNSLMDKLPDDLPPCKKYDSHLNIIHLNPNQTTRVEITSENTAYIIYTSGSTGKPKGVVISHRPVINLIEWVNHTFAINSKDNLLFTTSIGFDLSVYDMFGILAAGGTIYIVSDKELQDPKLLGDLLLTKPITFWNSAPAMLQQLVPMIQEEVSHKTNNHLRLVFLSGDWIPLSLPGFIKKYFDNAQVVSLGGATEATIWSNYYCVNDVATHWKSIPYGKPIQNAQYYILNSDLNPCPICSPGVLYIAGECLFDSYFNDPVKTAEKLIPNRFSDKVGDRLYNTGDLARFLPDGNIEFLGRIDHQVKIRGFRVELEEIEAVLVSHPAIQDAIAVVYTKKQHDNQIIAYLVIKQNQSIEIKEIKNFIRSKLPLYMVPSFFIFLDTIPLTQNGKIDRKSLPKPDFSKYTSSGGKKPQNNTEKVLILIWSSTLGIENIGIHDNFFDLGGHSLSATQVIYRINEKLSFNLPVRTIFEAPTIASLAERINEDRIKKTESHKIERQLPSDNYFPLSFAQERLWLIDKLEGHSSMYNMSASLQLIGELNQNILLDSIKEIIQRHDILRTTFVTDNLEPKQLISQNVTLPYETIDLQEFPKNERFKEAIKIIVHEAQYTFHLDKGPLFKVLLIVLNNKKHILSTTMHHIISDGWSMGIFFREITSIYNAILQGKPHNLIKLPIQYHDYAIWQRKQLQRENLKKQLDFWKTHLNEAPLFLELPFDRPRPFKQTYRGRIETFRFLNIMTEKIKNLSKMTHSTLFMTLMSAFGCLLSHFSGQDDIVIGTPIANRTRAEIEDLIGFFVNTLALRINLNDNPTFIELVERVRHIALDAYTHQDLPFERLVEEIQPKRDPSISPIFQVMFAFQNTPQYGNQQSSLKFYPLDVDIGTSKFDLTLFITEEGQQLKGDIEYNQDLFDIATIKRMIESFKLLIESVVTNPYQRIADISLVSDTEQLQIFSELNQ